MASIPAFGRNHGKPSSARADARSDRAKGGDSDARPGKSRRREKRVRRKRLSAKGSDKYDLYQRSVQSPEADVQFLARVYRRRRGRNALHLREDFCGTALLMSHWVKRGSQYTAEGFDIDPEPVEWGLEHNFSRLKPAARERAVVHLADAREPSRRTPDVRCAQNFSYWLFKSRKEMLAYFRGVYEDLAPDGMFVIDAHGGPEAIEEMEEETECDGFTYVWDQHFYSPVTGEAKLHIHFRFPDGSEMSRAFSYDWRVWTLPELKEILEEAGFPEVDCYWEGTDEDGESGNGIFRKTRYGTNDPAWVAYLVAAK